MSKDEGGVLDFLKSQLSFIESGGYTDLERSKSGRALIFRDSPGCLLSGNAQRSSSCYDCPLMEFVPPADRSRNLPCHGVPVGLNGETVREAAADSDQQHLTHTVAQWLQSKIRSIEQAQRHTGLRDARPTWRPQRPQILIVDDDEGIPIVLEHLLEGKGCDTTRARNGHTALRDLSRRSFDLILLDDYLPDISAEVFLRQASSLERPVPVILMQSGPLPRDLTLKYVQLGVRLFVCRHSPNEVVGLVGDCLEGSQPVKAAASRASSG